VHELVLGIRGVGEFGVGAVGERADDGAAGGLGVDTSDLVDGLDPGAYTLSNFSST